MNYRERMRELREDNDLTQTHLISTKSQTNAYIKQF